MSIEEIKELNWREENVDLSELMATEVGKIQSLKDRISHIMARGKFPSKARKLRHNTITLED